MEIITPILVTNPTNIRYLTGFVGAAPEEREAYCLVAQDNLCLFTNALYQETARKLNTEYRIVNTDLRIIEISREHPISKELAKIVRELGIKKLSFEDTNLTVAELKRLKTSLPSIELVPTSGIIETMRQAKRPREIDSIREACRITDECFTYILTLLKPGVSESEIAWEIRTFFAKRGATDAFSPIVAFGAHSSMPHYSPAQSGKSFGLPQDKQGSVLEKNDVALFDYGARVSGYCSDMTRVVFVGKPKDEWIKSYNIVLAAQQAAIDILYKYFDLSINRRGAVEISGAAMDQAARDVITKAGLPVYPHSLGHAVGLDIHESPRLSIANNDLPSAGSGQSLKPGTVFSVEPGVYVEGSYGIRIEDLILMKDDGIEILSKSKKELIII